MDRDFCDGYENEFHVENSQYFSRNSEYCFSNWGFLNVDGSYSNSCLVEEEEDYKETDC